MEIVRTFKDSAAVEDTINILSESGLPRGTHIFFIDDSTGKIYREEHNKVVLAGAQFTACKHFDIPVSVTLPNYNTELGIGNVSTQNMANPVPEYTYLFCCGTSGCGIEASQVYPVLYHSRINPSAVIPFRYENSNNDLNKQQRQIYFGRKEFPDEGKIAYYYKAFDSQPQIYSRFVDGTMIDNTVYSLQTTQKAVTMVQVRLKITMSDFRDWFFAKDGIENARINTLSLLTGWKSVDSRTGYVYYNDVRPLTQLNFTNEWLIDLTKSITIIYQIMY